MNAQDPSAGATTLCLSLPFSARQGSRVSIQGKSRQEVSFPTLCPLGQPNKAVGLESPIKPWLAHAHPGSLQAQQSRTGRTRPKAMIQSPYRSAPHRHASAQSIALASRGRMSQKHLTSATRERCFLLTSPLIERFPHPRRWDRCTTRCATLAISIIQITGQATSPTTPSAASPICCHGTWQRASTLPKPPDSHFADRSDQSRPFSQEGITTRLRASPSSGLLSCHTHNQRLDQME